MKYFLLACLIIAASCNNPTDTNTATKDSSAYITHEDSIPKEFFYDESMDYATMYMVVSDTGKNYYTLRNSMFNINSKTGIAIDTLGKYFDTKKNKVILPEDSEDELYAGDYILRRFGEDFLSIEYLSSYIDNTTENTMVIVAGIFEDKSTADSMALAIKTKQLQARVITTEMYIGCMH